MKVARSLWKFSRGQNGVIGFRRHLVSGEFSHKVLAPRFVVFGIVNDTAAFLPVVNHGMENVSTGLSLVDALDPVALEFTFQDFVEIEFRTFAKFLCRLIIRRPL